jgi:hypothetical protein
MVCKQVSFSLKHLPDGEKKTLVYTPSGKYFKEKNTCLHTHQVSVKKTTTLIYAPSGKCLKKQQHLFTHHHRNTRVTISY